MHHPGVHDQVHHGMHPGSHEMHHATGHEDVHGMHHVQHVNHVQHDGNGAAAHYPGALHNGHVDLSHQVGHQVGVNHEVHPHDHDAHIIEELNRASNLHNA